MGIFCKHGTPLPQALRGRVSCRKSRPGDIRILDYCCLIEQQEITVVSVHNTTSFCLRYLKFTDSTGGRTLRELNTFLLLDERNTVCNSSDGV